MYAFQSRSSQSDQRATITTAQFEALHISPRTPPPPPIVVHRAPEYVPSNLSDFDGNLPVAISQTQREWSPLQMTATVDSSLASPRFNAGAPNSENRYCALPLRYEQYNTEHMNAFSSYSMPTHSQPNYYYPGPAHSQLTAYGIEHESSMSQEFPTNFTNRNSPSQGYMRPEALINMPPPSRHHYSLEQPQSSSARQQKDRISITLSEHDPQDQVSRPNIARDEYIQHGYTSHSSAELYSTSSTNLPSLMPDYMNQPAPNVTGHTYLATSSLYEPLHPYQSPQQYSFPPTSDTGVAATPALADGFSTPYSVSPAPEDQVRIVNSRPKPQCWDHGCNGREFSTFSNLLRHQREKAGTATKSECPHCGTVFTRTTARNGHLAQGKCKAKREQQ
ncbi:hypothetical protein I7I48_08627 [Histoplasma ohiense]|nr:hypothetical protein I7I48_08627 [Histoplasma ohiense (nom. inval.)]